MPLNSARNLFSYLWTRKSVIENITLMVGFRAFKIALSGLTTYFVVRSLSQADYGHYNFILTIIGVLSIFSLPGIPALVTQSVARGFPGTFRHALKISMTASLCASLILMGFAGWYQWFSDQSGVSIAFLCAAFFFPLTQTLSLWTYLRAGEEKFRNLVTIGSLNYTLASIAMIAAAVYYPGNILLLLIIWWTIPALQNINQTIRILRGMGKDAPPEPGALKFGLKTSLYSVATVISANIDRLLVFTFLSPEALAIFVVCEKFPDIIREGVQNIGKALMPRFARQKGYTISLDKFFKIFALAMSISILAFTFTIFPFLFDLIFGETYAAYLMYGQILMVSVAIANVAPLKRWFISARLDIKSNRELMLILSAAKIVISVALVPIFGLEGAIASIFLQRIFAAVLVHVIMKKRYPLIIQTDKNIEKSAEQELGVETESNTPLA